MKRCLFVFVLLSLLLAVPAMAAEEVAPEDIFVVVYSIDPQPDRETGQLPALLSELFGEYQQKTYTVTKYAPNGDVVISQQYVPGIAGMDFAWLASVCLFGLVIFCFLKLVGGVLKL